MMSKWIHLIQQTSIKWLDMFHLITPVFFRVASLVLGESYDFLGAHEIILNHLPCVVCPINSLRPNDAIWRHISGSTWEPILTNYHWGLVTFIWRHFQGELLKISVIDMHLKNTNLKLQLHSSWKNEFNAHTPRILFWFLYSKWPLGISVIITLTSWWARWRLKSQALRLFAQSFIQAQIKENTKAPRHWPLWGEFTGDRWISRTKGQ